MAQLNLIPGRGYVFDNDQDQLNLIPGVGYVAESAAAGGGVTASLTGIGSTSGAGVLFALGSADLSLSGVSVTGSAGTLTAGGFASVGLDGVSSTASAGTITTVGAANVSITGVSATGAPGNLNIVTAGGLTVTLSGVSSTAEAGSALDSRSNIVTDGGFDGPISTWVEGPGWSISFPASSATHTGGLGNLQQSITYCPVDNSQVYEVSLTNVGSTTPDSVTVALKDGTPVDVYNLAPGTTRRVYSKSGQLGVPGITISVVGDLELGEVKVRKLAGVRAFTDSSLSVYGISSVSSVGDIGISLATIASLAGVSASAVVGAVDITGGASVNINGVFTTGGPGSVTITGDLTNLSSAGSFRFLTVEAENRTILVIAQDTTHTIQ